MSSTGINRVVRCASPFRSELWLHRERPLPGVTNCRLAQPVSTATEACKKLAVKGSGA